MKRSHAVFSFLLFVLLPTTATAQYNPAKDNPYIHLGDGQSKKWYEFYKQEKQSAYITKNSGYWYSTKQENVLVRGAKSVFEGIKEIAQTVLS